MPANVLAMVEDEVRSWPGVSEAPGRFNSVAFRYGKREIGHIHRNGIADLPFTRTIHDELIAQGRAEPHQAGSRGYVSVPMRTEIDVPNIVELFRMNYERAKASAERRAAQRS